MLVEILISNDIYLLYNTLYLASKAVLFFAMVSFASSVITAIKFC